ncbi:hypothetical protein [Streptomyces flavofungini]|uniref:hypothetical protein n=1 Tax=Streptomyces flavofungini TaxID=68200 RepID=UPI0025AF152A|nr:hypothetical protein [Streptomyces flavofungini]WJV44129.1 hypothetical protein QUY26_00360 [Streptomyces flavofungini]
MSQPWNEQRLIADGFERTYTVLDWYDGPRKGLAVIRGVPHYFEGWDYDPANAADEYDVWPASEAAVAMEREQWAIYVEYEVSDAGRDEHPANGGVNARYDELDSLLVPHRRPPDRVRRLVGEVRLDDGDRYRLDGGDLWMRWRPSSEASAGQGTDVGQVSETLRDSEPNRPTTSS